jgi:hypothetical protein
MISLQTELFVTVSYAVARIALDDQSALYGGFTSA